MNDCFNIQDYLLTKFKEGLSALEEVVYVYPDTHAKGATWKRDLVKSYKKHYEVELHIPRWMDIRDKYKRRSKRTEY